MQRRKWAEDAIEILQMGQVAQIRPIGHSLEGRVSNGDLVTVEPCYAKDLVIGDIVLARVQGRCHSHLVLHLIIAREANLFLLGNNHGRSDGWIEAESIFGKATKVEPPPDDLIGIV